MANNKLIGIVLVIVALLAAYFTYSYYQKEKAEQARKEAAMEKIMNSNPNPKAEDPHRPSDKGPYGKFKTKAYDNEKKALDRSVDRINEYDENTE